MNLLCRHFKCIKIALFILLPASIILPADEIVLHDGTMISGAILHATEDSIAVSIGDRIQDIGQADVLTIRFSRSDLIILMDGSKVEGKVITKEGDDVIVATALEITKVANNTIKQVHYNVGATLQIPHLPPTGRQFQNDPAGSVISSEFQPSVSGSAILGLHYPELKDWREQFYLEDGDHPETSGIQIGGKVSYAFNKNISLEGGYEHFVGPKIKVEMTEPNFTDKISYNYIYAGVKFGWSSATNLTIHYFATLDGGFLKGTEDILDMEGVDFEALSQGTVARIAGGVEYYTSKSTSLMISLAFLMANLEETEMLGIEIPNYAHNFSGLSLLMSYTYHIPFSF